MKLKHLGLFAMIGLFAWSCSDDKSDFNGDNGTGQIAARCSADYNVAIPKGSSATPEAEGESEIESLSPEIGNFAVQLKKSDGSFDQTWSSLDQFPIDKKFSVGAYEMSIWYGDIAEEGFEKPYYFGNTTFEVEDEETVSPSIVAKLANSMVSLNYTEAFKNYFTSYSAKVRTASGTIIDFANDETRPVYVKPGKVTFQLNMVKTNGVELSLEPAGIDNAAACTHYRVTFDVNGGEVGDAVLTVTFDDETATQTVEVTLSDELTVSPAPIITTKGFTSGTAIDIIEGDKADASLAIVAQAGIKSVTLNTASEYLASKGWPAEIDLMAATAEQKALLAEYGLDNNHIKGLWNNPDKMAVINFAELIPLLSPLNGNSTHKFTVQVTDVYGRVAESAAELIVNAPAVILNLSDALKSEAGSLQGTFTLTYNGDMDNISFTARNDYGNFVDAPIKSYTKTGDNTYTVTVTIPENGSKTTIKGYYKGVEKSSIDMKIGKTFTLSAEDYDIWATKATVKVSTKVTEFKDVVMANLKSVSVNGTETTAYTVDAANHLITINGLTAGSANTVKVVSLDDDGDEVFATITLNTETAAQLGNSDMESWTTNTWTWTPTGGAFGGGAKDVKWYQPWAGSDRWWDTTVKQSMPSSSTGWTSVYVKCCPSGGSSTDAHTGTYSAHLSVVNIGSINTASTAVGTDYVCEMFIGTANDSGNHSTDGHAFSSRPTSMSFYYKLANNNGEAFSVTYWLKASDGTVLTEGTITNAEATDTWKQYTIPFTYSVTNKKAATVYVSFKSTTASDPSVSTGASREIGGENIEAHWGSELRIDDIVLNY